MSGDPLVYKLKTIPGVEAVYAPGKETRPELRRRELSICI